MPSIFSLYWWLNATWVSYQKRPANETPSTSAATRKAMSSSASALALIVVDN
ncbi:hypothetical protein D3C87_1775390 [compost metagenome]